MKNLIKFSGIALMMALGFQAQAQDVDVLVVEEEGNKTLLDRSLPNFQYPDQRGVNVFEPKKDITLGEFEGVQVRVGGASTIQFQGLSQESEGPVELVDLGSNFNLATANLDLDVLLAPGLRMHLRTYLSSQHHPEAYVKGGYIQIDGLDFISEGLASGLMEHLRIKIGHMENNYGDGHFRRSDNAEAIHNPFVGNYVMDAFTTEVGAEVYYFNGPWLGMVGFTNGKLNQNVTDKNSTSPSWLAKIGYDDQISENFRFRLTGSVLHAPHNYGRGVYLYSGDRAGSRYYSVLSDVDGGGDGFRGGMLVPDINNDMTAFQINPFFKLGGLEFFGIIENVTGRKKNEANSETRSYNQYSGELLYRFGADEDFYIGGRYNTAGGEDINGNDLDVDRFQLGAGWFLTKNVLAKVEYVNQDYSGYPTTDIHNEGNFNGFMIEATIGF
ncbi:hypothetical protein SAMN06296241_1296 [Salinimicrobium sediminis]|uniref:Phosphate-selective porin O and P n=2 Tax=Salinimicrobium sediminis TaxID=1343891 RepID=A0A285X375_9FLAO|nr:hypothetical protein SAMN06296241_1296 [Salinimicrobium sediminis]